MAEAEQTSRGADHTTRGLSPKDRIALQGFMEQVRAHEKALGIDRRGNTASKPSNTKSQGK